MKTIQTPARTILAVERHRQIVGIVDRDGSARATDLAKAFNVTQETIRLDLEKLEEEGLLLRKHGGAVTIQSLHPETPFSQRQVALVEEKAAIAREALREIKEGDTILLDASSTAWQLSRLISDMPLTVVTHAVKVAVELSSKSNVRVLGLGGTLSSASLSFVGPITERWMKEFHVDKAFMSCTGMDLQRGASDAHEWQAALKACMMQGSDFRCLMIDHSKFHVKALSVFAQIPDFDLIITDNRIDDEVREKLQKKAKRYIEAAVD